MQTIYFLTGYNWEKAELISEGKKNYKLLCDWGNDKKVCYIPKDKCAFPDEEVCVVWEQWKGINGRGGYRVERELYSNDRVPAGKVHYQQVGRNALGRITETAYGVSKCTTF